MLSVAPKYLLVIQVSTTLFRKSSLARFGRCAAVGRQNFFLYTRPFGSMNEDQRYLLRSGNV